MEISLDAIEKTRIKISDYYLREGEKIFPLSPSCRKIYDVSFKSTLNAFRRELKLIERQKKFALKEQKKDDRANSRRQKTSNRLRRRTERVKFRAEIKTARILARRRKKAGVNPPSGVVPTLVEKKEKVAGALSAFSVAKNGEQKKPKSLKAIREGGCQ